MTENGQWFDLIRVVCKPQFGIEFGWFEDFSGKAVLPIENLKLEKFRPEIFRLRIPGTVSVHADDSFTQDINALHTELLEMPGYCSEIRDGTLFVRLLDADSDSTHSQLRLY